MIAVGIPDDLLPECHVPYPFRDPEDFKSLRWICIGHGHKNDAGCAFACGWIQWSAGIDGPPLGLVDDTVSVTYKLVKEFFDGDVTKTVAWFTEPNPQFGGASANDLILLGRNEKLLRWVIQALAENPPREEVPAAPRGWPANEPLPKFASVEEEEAFYASHDLSDLFDAAEEVEPSRDDTQAIIDEANAAADAADEIVAQVAAEGSPTRRK